MAKQQKRKKPIIKGVLRKLENELPSFKETISYVQIVDLKISNFINDSIRFDTCHLKNVTFFSNEFDRAEFIDVIFENCDLSNNSFTNSSFHRCEFIDCKFTGSHFVESLLQDVLISNAMAKFIDIANSKLNRCDIVQSEFSESNWFENSMKHMIIENSKLNKSTIYNTKFNGIDLSTSGIKGLKIDAQSIEGITISSWQAAEVCHLLGISIK